MDLSSIDLRFCEIERELWALDEYVDLVERRLPAIQDAESDFARERLFCAASALRTSMRRHGAPSSLAIS